MGRNRRSMISIDSILIRLWMNTIRTIRMKFIRNVRCSDTRTKTDGICRIRPTYKD